MLNALIVIVNLAGAAEECDRRATIAGQLMFLHQSGAASPAVTSAALASALPDFASSIVGRVVSAETSADTSVRELAAFHFAVEVHDECHVSGARMS